MFDTSRVTLVGFVTTGTDTTGSSGTQGAPLLFAERFALGTVFAFAGTDGVVYDEKEKENFIEIETEWINLHPSCQVQLILFLLLHRLRFLELLFGMLNEHFVDHCERPMELVSS